MLRAGYVVCVVEFCVVMKCFKKDKVGYNVLNVLEYWSRKSQLSSVMHGFSISAVNIFVVLVYTRHANLTQQQRMRLSLQLQVEEEGEHIRFLCGACHRVVKSNHGGI